MSIENIQKFQDRVAAEPDLQSRIVDIPQAVVRETAEKVAALSDELGIPFTAEEFLAAQFSAPASCRNEILTPSPVDSLSTLGFLQIGDKLGT